MGDPVCWLSETCLACGRFLDAQVADGQRCPHCGAELPPADGAERRDRSAERLSDSERLGDS